MRKLQIQGPEEMKFAIRQQIGCSEESRYNHRLHGLLLVANGQSCRGVAELLGEDARAIQRWVHRFEQCGLQALRDGERPGRSCLRNERQWR